MSVLLLDGKFCQHTHRLLSNLQSVLSICSLQTVVELTRKLKILLDFDCEMSPADHGEDQQNVFQNPKAKTKSAKTLYLLLKLNRMLDMIMDSQPVRFMQRYLTLLYIESVVKRIPLEVTGKVETTTTLNRTDSTHLHIKETSSPPETEAKVIDWNAQPVNGLQLVLQFLQVESTFTAGLNKEFVLLLRYSLCIHYALSSFQYVKRNKVCIFHLLVVSGSFFSPFVVSGSEHSCSFFNRKLRWRSIVFVVDCMEGSMIMRPKEQRSQRYHFISLLKLDGFNLMLILLSNRCSPNRLRMNSCRFLLG